MPRVIWKGAVGFSLIHIPVALHTASREQSLSFDMLDRRDCAPVGYQHIKEKFRQANVEATKTIDIQGLVERGSIPAAYYEKPNY